MKNSVRVKDIYISADGSEQIYYNPREFVHKDVILDLDLGEATTTP